jgi:hypothetical protein
VDCIVLRDFKLSNKRKPALELEQRILISNDVEAGNKQSAVVMSLNLSKQTVSSILQNRDKLHQAFESYASNNRKRLLKATFDGVQEVLLKFFTIARSQNVLSVGLCIGKST